jgi:hypothetical protein
MRPRIAILGGGSLLWEGGAEFDRWHDEWRPDGPLLMLEFSRVSSRRLDALTLVIDREHGVPNKVAWCISRRPDPDDVIADLRCREDTTLKNIGHVLLAQLGGKKPDDQPARDIAVWAKDHELDAVVWTKLASNFLSRTKRPFSVSEAVAHLKKLSTAGKVKAAEYICRAPEFISTPLRSAVQKEPWFVEKVAHDSERTDQGS